MNRNKYHIIVLINQLNNFLRCIPVRDTHKSGKLSDSMINMHHIITRFEHVKLFQRKCNLTTSCLITAQIIFMKTVKYLMIGKNTAMQRMIDKSFMQSTVYSCKIYFITTLTKDICQSVRLFYTVRTYINGISPL